MKRVLDNIVDSTVLFLSIIFPIFCILKKYFKLGADTLHEVIKRYELFIKWVRKHTNTPLILCP